MIPDRGDLIWLNFSPQKGHEQAGRRPAIVISPQSYNNLSHCALVCPITSNTSPWPWKVFLDSTSEIEGAVLTDQLKSIDLEARSAEFTGHRVGGAKMLEILDRLNSLTQ